MRGFTIAFALLTAAVEPLSGEVDMFKYALAQGGLLAVVLVLLWAFRREFRRQIADEQDKTKAADHRLDTMMALVAQTNTAMQKTFTVGEVQERAIHRLARAIEKLEESE